MATITSASTKSAAHLVKVRGAPVVYWAALGTAFLCLAAYIWGSWILSPDFKPSPVGPDPLPHNVWIAIRAVETITTLAIIGTLWFFIFRPLVRNGSIGFDGLLVINFLLMWWTDPMVNYFNFSFMYNAHTVNMGNWAAHIPGWSYPNQQNLPEPLLMMGGFYISVFILTTLFGCWLLKKTTEKWPSMSMAGSIAILALATGTIALVVENALMRTGIAAYPGVIKSMSLFPNEVYQWPLYEVGCMAFVSTSFTCLRYFRNDKGQTFVEKGIDNLNLSAGKKKLVTFLALAGFIQPFFTFGYYVPYNLFAIHADTFPAYPSYMRAEICGEGTQYACPSREWVPIPTRDSKLMVGPDDPRLPQEVRNAQGISASGKDPYASE